MRRKRGLSSDEMACRAKGCGERSSGPRFGFRCRKHWVRVRVGAQRVVLGFGARRKRKTAKTRAQRKAVRSGGRR